MEELNDDSHNLPSNRSFVECDWLKKLFLDQLRILGVTELADNHSLCRRIMTSEGVSWGVVCCCHGAYFVDSELYHSILTEGSSQFSGETLDPEEIVSDDEHLVHNDDGGVEVHNSPNFSNWLYNTMMNLNTENDHESNDYLDGINTDLIEFDRSNESRPVLNVHTITVNSDIDIGSNSVRPEPENEFQIPDPLHDSDNSEEYSSAASPQNELNRFYSLRSRVSPELNLSNSFAIDSSAQNSNFPSDTTGQSEIENNSDECFHFTCPICLEETPTCFPYNTEPFRHSVCTDCTRILLLRWYIDELEVLSCPICRRELNFGLFATSMHARIHHVHE